MTSEQHPLITLIAEGTVGGLARQLQLLAATIPQRECLLHMIVSCDRDPAFMTDVRAFRDQGISVDIISMQRAPSPSADWQSYKEILACLSKVRPDAVHTHCSKAGILGRRAAFKLGIPAIHTPHVFAFEWEKSYKRTIYRFLEQRAANWCNAIVMLSELQKQRTLAAEIATEDKLVIIPNGVNCSAYSPPTPEERHSARKQFGIQSDGVPVVGVAARLEPQKGMGNFFRAARKVCDKHPQAKFLVAGSGSLEGECRERVKQLGLDEAVMFCGDVPHMREFYHALDCFLLASLWEGLPYVILEAMASSLPVVFTQSFGMEGLVVDGENGLVAELDDIDALAGHTCRIIESLSLAKTLGNQARARVEKEFSLDIWADKTADLYKRIARGSSGSG